MGSTATTEHSGDYPRQHRVTGSRSMLMCSYLVQLVLIGCILTQAAAFTPVDQCTDAFAAGHKLNRRNVNFCLNRGGSLHSLFPARNPCLNQNEAIVIVGYELLLPKQTSIDYSGMQCSENLLNGFHYASRANATCMQRHGQTRDVKNALLPLMRMYNGRTAAEMREVDTSEFRHHLGPDGLSLPYFTWLKIQSTCAEKRSTSKLLYSDICSNVEQKGASSVYIDFLAEGGGYVNHSACSCNIFSYAQDPKVTPTLKVQAIDVRMAGAPAQLYLNGNDGSKTLDGSEVLYWAADGDLLVSRESLFLELRKLTLRSLPGRVWLQVTGHNLTVNCGPKSEPGGHQPLSSDSGALGIGYIIAIIVCLILLIILAILIVKCVFTRRRRRGSMKDDEEDYDLTMGSHEDIQDRLRLQAVHRQKSATSTAEPPEMLETEAEVTYSSPRMMSAPVAAADESQEALLQNAEEGNEDDDDTYGSNNNTAAKKPPATPPPPRDDPAHHEYMISRQFSYIDDEDDKLPAPPPLAYHPSEDIYNHLNEQTRPDVVPGNIYDTSPSGENLYSSTQAQKSRGTNGPVDDHYVM